MGLRDRILDPVRRARRAAAAAAEVWASAPAPAAPIPPAPPNAFPTQTPTIDWTREKPAPQPRTFQFTPGYSDRTYEQFSAPLAFDGFDQERIRAAISMHRFGYFLESAALLVAMLGYAPVAAAMGQAIAPICALPRHVHGGDSGISRLVRDEIQDIFVPRNGLLPSPYFAPTLAGTTALHLRGVGFAVWQVVYGDPDPDTRERMPYVRIWQPWAVLRTRTPQKTIAITTAGNVEICNDGKFILLEAAEEGHLHKAALPALGDPVFSGRLTQAARDRFLDFWGDPKLWLTMPPNIVMDETPGGVGESFAAGVHALYGPQGEGVFPHGSEVHTAVASGEGSNAFSGAILDDIIQIFMVLTGSAGTIGNGQATGAGGPYQPAKGGAWGVRHDLIAEPLLVIARGMNAVSQGHCDINHAEAIARAKRVGRWKYPVIEIPLPSPDRAERIADEAARAKMLTDQLQEDEKAGVQRSGERISKLAKRFETDEVQLVSPGLEGAITDKDMEDKLFAPDELREQRGYGPMPNGAGSLERLAEERAAGGDKTGALARVNAAATTAAAAPEDAAAAEGAEGPPGDEAADPQPAAALEAALRRLDVALEVAR